MAVTRYTLNQGETGPIIRPRPSVLATDATIDSNWACRTSVNDADGTEVIAPRVVTDKTDDNMYFVVALTPTETASLTVEEGCAYTMYSQIVEITNDTLTPEFNIEDDYDLKIKPGGMTNV